MGTYTTKELSKRTWPDFEALFSRGNGWDFCCCMAFQRRQRLSSSTYPTRAALRVVNHREKRQLVERRRAHGILVYLDGDPIGWCQYGPAEELPFIDNARGKEGQELRDLVDADWRITCFVTDKRYRKQGVAGAALRAALDAIRKRGGGVVEAYPIVAASQDGGPPERPVAGLGMVRAAHGSFGNASTTGTVSMFTAEGFKPVTTIGRGQVLVRKSLRPRRAHRAS
jgi:GNAT superfamily N-acetyltransferase